tara:strand:- start:3652 stop:5784 length:2133 start_codon:yes stop_codon:yes gene_type:complete
MARRTSGVDLEYRARLDKYKKDLEEMGGLQKREIRKMASQWQDKQRDIARTARKEARDVAKAWDGATNDINQGLSDLIPGFGLVSEAAERLTSGMGLAGGALALTGVAAAATAGFIALKSAVMEDRLELARLAAEGAQTIETIQALQMVARRSAYEFSDFHGVIEDLPERLLDASRGSGELDEALEIMGGSIRKANGEVMSSAEALPHLIEMLQAVPDDANRSALATLALGDSGRALMAAMGSTAFAEYVEQVEKFGLKVGPEAVAAAKEWKKETAVLEELWNQLGHGIADLGNKHIPKLNSGIVVSSVFLSEYLGAVKDDFVELGSLLADTAGKFMSGDFGGAASALDDVALAGADALIPFENLLPAVEKARATLENFRAEIKIDEGDFGLGDEDEDGDGSGKKPDAEAEKRRKKREQAQKQLDAMLKQSIQAQLEGEDLVNAKLAERLELIGELALATGDQLTASMAATEAIANAEMQLADLRAKQLEADLAAAAKLAQSEEELAELREEKHEEALRRRQELASAAWDLADTLVDSFRFIAEQQAKRAEDGNEAALRSARAWWAAYKAGAIAQSIVQTSLAIGQALATIAPPASFVVAGAMAAAGALQVATIAAQKPSFHSGGVMMTDERAATLRAGEGVITPEAIAALGRLNRGEAPSGGAQTVAVYGHRLFDTIEVDRARVPTSAASRLRRRASRTRPGRSTTFAR